MAPVPPEVVYDVQNIHTALTYAVPDQEALVNIIGRREYQQLIEIARYYKSLYNTDLATELDRRIIGSVGSLLSFACMNRVLAGVLYLHNAGKSKRKYEVLRKNDTAVEVLVGRTPEEIRELQGAFTAVYHSDLRDHIMSYLHDDVVKAFFTAILQDKEEKPLEDRKAAIEKFHSLLYGHDLAAVLEYVSSLTTAQLCDLVRHYNMCYQDSHTVTTIRKQFGHKHKGEQLDVLLFAVMQASDPARHIALLLENSMYGLGTNEDQLSRLVVLHRGNMMERVKTAYHVDNSRTLADRIR
ncbi:hypothetical protein BX616_007231, partial [Lobosporangium transversale]